VQVNFHLHGFRNEALTRT